MPKHEQDVIDLMNFTRGFKALILSKSLYHVNGKLGRFGHVLQEICGSITWTFASLDNAGAPGQLVLQICVESGSVWMQIDGYTRLAACCCQSYQAFYFTIHS